MSLMVTKREYTLINSGQARTIIRAHRKVHYPQGVSVPAILDKETPSPFTVQVIGVLQGGLSSVDDARAREAGFRNKVDFKSHWGGALYGKDGIDSGGGGDRLKDDCPIVVYRIRKVDGLVQARLKAE